MAKGLSMKLEPSYADICEFIGKNMDFFEGLVQQTQLDGKEHGCNICTNEQSGEVEIGSVCHGTDCQVDLKKSTCLFGDIVGTFHTHPALKDPRENEIKPPWLFSPNDLRLSFAEKEKVACLGYTKNGKPGVKCLTIRHDKIDRSSGPELYKDIYTMNQYAYILKDLMENHDNVLDIYKKSKAAKEPDQAFIQQLHDRAVKMEEDFDRVQAESNKHMDDFIEKNTKLGFLEICIDGK
jgi:hypothetical protein